MKIELSNTLKNVPENVFYPIFKLISEESSSNIPLLNAGIGVPDSDTPELLLETLEKAIRKPENMRYGAFDGKETLTTGQLRRKRQDIGMIFQHFNLMSQKTAEENVAFALKHSGLSEKDKKAKVAELLDLVGLADRAENYPSQLSGGQKQRVAIARALANDPKILISDESTSALDPKTTKQILALLQDLNQKLGLTVVLITHEMQIVKDIANRVAVMQDGRLIEEGSVLEIFSDPKQPLTQDFISTATGIDEAMVKIEKQEIVEHLSENSILVQLKYAGASTDEPLLNELYKHYQVTANILYGNIEILDGTPVGELVVVLSGEKEALAKAQEAIRQAGVQLKVLKGGQ